MTVSDRNPSDTDVMRRKFVEKFATIAIFHEILHIHGMFSRILDLQTPLQHRSLFLFGPRQTGKSTLLRGRFPKALYIDLLAADTFRELSARPELLRQRLQPETRLVIIDEVQKLPSLLDEVQLLIDRHPELRCIMTGSSARKLKRGAANLLGGRAWRLALHPLVSAEIGDEALDRRLQIGSLPSVWQSPNPEADLRNYVGLYLQEEIQSEGLTRSIEQFSRFLPVAAQTSGEQVNFTAVGSDAGVAPRTIREYYQILEDTLVGFQLPAFRKTTTRKAVATAKFYLFDVGVANTLLQRGVVARGSESYGRALEHQVFLELRAYLDYTRSSRQLTYWRSTSQLEVDFVIDDAIAIEVKAKERVHARDYRGIRALAEDLPLTQRLVVSLESAPRTTDDGTVILPAEEFFRQLWSGALIVAA